MRFDETLTVAAKSHKMTQLDLAKLANTNSAVTSRTMNGKTLPSHELLTALCAPSTWPDKETGLHILRAWLEDETVRAGRSIDELDIAIRGDNPSAREVEEDIRLIRDWLPGNPDVRAMLRFLADTARRERDATIKRSAPLSVAGKRLKAQTPKSKA